MNKRRVMRCDSLSFREDESMFREDKVQQTSLLFNNGARVGAFLHDSAHVTSAGVFPYNDGKGGIRMEYRPIEEVSAPEFLRSMQGIPLTNLHPKGPKNSKDSIIGLVKSEGVAEETQDPKFPVNVRSEIVVHDAEHVTSTKVRGLSLGFSCDVIEEGGLTPWGEKYDAIQRNLRADHLALVPNPRVKNARVNLDNDDTGKPKMPMIRLDNGCEYEAAAEVIAELNRLRADSKTATDKATAETARADGLQAKVDGHAAELTKVKNDAESGAFERARVRLELEAAARDHKVIVKADATDSDVMCAIIKAVRGDSFNLDGKSDAYVQAAYDMVVGEKPNDKPPRQSLDHEDTRGQGNHNSQPRNDSAPKGGASDARARMIAGQ